MKRLEMLKEVYETRRFNIIAYHGDNKFNIQALKTELLPRLLLNYDRDKYVHVADRYI